MGVARKIISEQDVCENELSIYKAGEVKLTDGFMVEPGGAFYAWASTDDEFVSYSYINTEELANTNECFAFRPFTDKNNPRSLLNTPLTCNKISNLKSFIVEEYTGEVKDVEETSSNIFQTKGLLRVEPNAQIIIYPNPTTNILWVTHPQTAQNISLYSSSGKLLIKQFNNMYSKTSFDLSPYTTGVYFIQIDNNPFQKIIKN